MLTVEEFRERRFRASRRTAREAAWFFLPALLMVAGGKALWSRTGPFGVAIGPVLLAVAFCAGQLMEWRQRGRDRALGLSCPGCGRVFRGIRFRTTERTGLCGRCGLQVVAEPYPPPKKMRGSLLVGEPFAPALLLLLSIGFLSAAYVMLPEFRSGGDLGLRIVLGGSYGVILPFLALKAGAWARVSGGEIRVRKLLGLTGYRYRADEIRQFEVSGDRLRVRFADGRRFEPRLSAMGSVEWLRILRRDAECPRTRTADQ